MLLSSREVKRGDRVKEPLGFRLGEGVGLLIYSGHGCDA